MLKGGDQDKILSDFEKRKIQTTGFKSSYFFTLLRDMTVAGVLADPTDTVGALAYRCAEGILKYHKSGKSLA